MGHSSIRKADVILSAFAELLRGPPRRTDARAPHAPDLEDGRDGQQAAVPVRSQRPAGPRTERRSHQTIVRYPYVDDLVSAARDRSDRGHMQV
jgi:hypothetical protein